MRGEWMSRSVRAWADVGVLLWLSVVLCAAQPASEGESVFGSPLSYLTMWATRSGNLAVWETLHSGRPDWTSNVVVYLYSVKTGGRLGFFELPGQQVFPPFPLPTVQEGQRPDCIGLLTFDARKLRPKKFRVFQFRGEDRAAAQSIDVQLGGADWPEALLFVRTLGLWAVWTTGAGDHFVVLIDGAGKVVRRWAIGCPCSGICRARGAAINGEGTMLSLLFACERAKSESWELVSVTFDLRRGAEVSRQTIGESIRDPAVAVDQRVIATFGRDAESRRPTVCIWRNQAGKLSRVAGPEPLPGVDTDRKTLWSADFSVPNNRLFVQIRERSRVRMIVMSQELRVISDRTVPAPSGLKFFAFYFDDVDRAAYYYYPENAKALPQEIRLFDFKARRSSTLCGTEGPGWPCKRVAAGTD